MYTSHTALLVIGVALCLAALGWNISHWLRFKVQQDKNRESLKRSGDYFERLADQRALEIEELNRVRNHSVLLCQIADILGVDDPMDVYEDIDRLVCGQPDSEDRTNWCNYLAVLVGEYFDLEGDHPKVVELSVLIQKRLKVLPSLPDNKPVGEKPFPAAGAWFPTEILGNPMREYQPGKWESAIWPSQEQTRQQRHEAFEKLSEQQNAGDQDESKS